MNHLSQFDNQTMAFLVIFLMVLTIREIVTFRGKHFLKYIFTPLVTASVILVAFHAYGNNPGNAYTVYIFWGLVLSLIADVLLMIVPMQFMLEGLIFFLVAHVLYIVGFSRDYVFHESSVLVAVLIIIPMGFLYNVLRKKAGEMAVPVLIYMAVISTMVFFAITGFVPGNPLKKAFIVGGAIFFLISDIILALDAFVKEIPHATVFVWALYAPGQMMLAVSCL
ncbi:MAG TPA: lysoplasmalogenase [Spirochaetota bacterium]|mgnify:CR=1 FL=1|nr:lysoplasmalogenase [Spirochaetota bacterium]HPI88282.1 lysoplasmalogenase [Spirochaetota bacterium]HPR47746.1 lysoplasmalogenase [Spirochaetota bacterium]